MAIVVTITADSPTQLAPMWAGLGGHTATVKLDKDHMWIDVDMRQADEDDTEPFDEDLVDQLVPIEDDDEDEIVEPTPAALHLISAEQQAAAERERHGTNPTATDRIVELLTQHPDRTFTAAQVTEHLPDINPNSISALLNQASGRGHIAKAGRGQYQAVDRSAVHDARRRAAAEAM